MKPINTSEKPTLFVIKEETKEAFEDEFTDFIDSNPNLEIIKMDSFFIPGESGHTEQYILYIFFYEPE